MSEQDDQLFGSEHVRVYRETDGERGYDWRGTEILLLTTIGNQSGEERTTPLIHRTDGENFVIVASKGGSPDDPAWFKNLSANPDRIEIQVKGDRFPVTASVAQDDERARLWKKMSEVWPDYDNYQASTDRQIPVVVLNRA
ncbi:MAG: nitroreductase family deazaflavin-dependent oxidoreductase [Solirubrobacterales bacterium]